MNIEISNCSGFLNYKAILQSSGSQSRNHLKGDSEFTVIWLVCMYRALPESSSMGEIYQKVKVSNFFDGKATYFTWGSSFAEITSSFHIPFPLFGF